MKIGHGGLLVRELGVLPGLGLVASVSDSTFVPEPWLDVIEALGLV